MQASTMDGALFPLHPSGYPFIEIRIDLVSGCCADHLDDNVLVVDSIDKTELWRRTLDLEQVGIASQPILGNTGLRLPALQDLLEPLSDVFGQLFPFLIGRGQEPDLVHYRLSQSG